MAIFASSGDIGGVFDVVRVGRRFPGAVAVGFHPAEFVGQFVEGDLAAGVLGNVEVFVRLSDCTRGHTSQTDVLFWFRGWVDRLVGGIQRGFRRKIEIDALGQIELLGDVGNFEGTHAAGLGRPGGVRLSIPEWSSRR